MEVVGYFLSMLAGANVKSSLYGRSEGFPMYLRSHPKMLMERLQAFSIEYFFPYCIKVMRMILTFK